MKEQTILIADSGSTKTDWVILNQGNILAEFQSIGLNPFYQTSTEIEDVLSQQVLVHVGAALDRIFFYGAGCANEQTSLPVRSALEAVFGLKTEINIGSDMLGAARGLCGKHEGIACILGTGANNALYKDGSIIHSIGSLGFWMGDEGSGAYLGKRLVVDFLQNDLPQDLHELFSSTFPEIDRLHILDHAYKQPFPNRYFARFSKFISEQIHLEYVAKMIEDSFNLFVQKYVLKHKNASQYPVHFTGSIAYYYQDILKRVLEKNNLQCGQIQKAPLQGLIAYHA